MKEERDQWGSRAGFILAAIGSAIGLGNIWRFPYIAASNGGGAFLVPYLFALLTAGIPILILEFAIGHKIKSSPAGVFGRINGKMKILGWVQTIIPMAIASYYVVIIGWTLNYITYSLSLKWGADTGGFFFSDFLNLSSGPMVMGGFNMSMLIPIILVWVINYVVLIGGIKDGIEKANKVLMPVLIVALLIITVRGITLPGAAAGLDYFFKPDFSKLLDPTVWIAAYGQIFFSLSICFGIMITYASYLPEKTDIVNNAFMTGLGNCSFSILSGISVFGVLGYMAMQQGVPVSEVATAGVGLAFVVFPEAINALPGLNGIFGAVFFASLLFAGLSSSLSILEVIVSGVVDKFNMKRRTAVTVTLGLGLALSLVYATGAGLYILDIVDHFVNQYAITLAGLVEIIFVAWFFNIESVRVYANEMSDFTVGRWWVYTLKYLTPALLIIMLITNTFTDFTKGYEGYSITALVVYGVGTLAIILIGGFALTKFKGSNEHESSMDKEVEM